MNYGEKIKLVFFGSSEFSVYVLDELLLHKIKPDLIITTPDKPKGRKLVLSPTPVKIWAQNHEVEVLDPASLKNNPDLISKLKTLSSDVFLVASYGKLIPREIFEIPEHKTLNIHPSLLPKYRGASPIISQILNAIGPEQSEGKDEEVGVSVMVISEGMDEGPVVIQKITSLDYIPNRKELEKLLAIEGARLFVHILPEWLEGAIDPIMQNEELATFCSKIKKEDGLLA